MLFPCCLYKALKESRTKRPGVKKTVSKKKSSETSAAMPPGRVMAPAPGQNKRILELDEPAHDRVTRQKAKMATATDHQESLLRVDSETSVQMGDDLRPMDEGTTLSMDGCGTVCLDEGGTIFIDEASTIHTDLGPDAPSIDRNAVINEEEQQLVLQSGKLTLQCYLLLVHFPNGMIMYAFVDSCICRFLF